MKWSFNALGTTWWIELFDDQNDNTLDEVQRFVEGFVSSYENNYSRFKANSNISVLNRERTLTNPSDECIKLLEYGKQMYLRTDTMFNFLTGHILEARGYDTMYSFIEKNDSTLTPGNPITDLSITADTIKLKHGNIDLGGYGKGYLIDLLTEQFKTRFNLEQFLINGGGDMYATHQAGAPITIHLEHPTQPGVLVAPTTLHNQGFAASSPHKRAWKTATGTQHHIVADTITADGTFVKAATAADADVFATAILQLTPPQIMTVAQSEQLAVAQVNVTTGMLHKGKNFD